MVEDRPSPCFALSPPSAPIQGSWGLQSWLYHHQIILIEECFAALCVVDKLPFESEDSHPGQATLEIKPLMGNQLFSAVTPSGRWLKFW